MFYFSLIDAILCYQCSDAKAEGTCRHDNSGLLSDNQGIQNRTNITDTEFNTEFTYLKNCTKSWGEQCLIENIREAGSGKVMSFIRGCTNGKVFSLNDFPNRTIVSDNQTTCAYRPESGKVVVCLTICKTDLCNGPQPPLHDGASSNHFCSLLAILMLLLVNKVNCFSES
ncbi:uncharacterized protein LOC133196944 [Saccostrea echinata]|uniref:uncharacterized protein LOC133196944 n=1 Tax=Saccostrea echinata TaxID=191078 RepID=UPI002A7FE3E0|nr:uncharacterized protein LOC133196944 [Saccostrea echinata]